jgi:uncharacterized protein YdeI (YjbR/CyaY-like superfamily)
MPEGVLFPDAAAFESWLDEHHETEDEVWVRFAKKGAAVPSVTYGEALEAALCFGWIDGKALGLDERFYLQRFTPRRPRSIWSRRNTEKAEALIAAGRMRPAGLAQVEAARADGRWAAAYDGSRDATVPDDLQRALDANPAAAEFFATLKGQNRYSILHRIQTARRPETRAKRIREYVAMLAERRTLHP